MFGWPFSPPIPSSSRSKKRLPIEIVTNVSDHGCNGPGKTDNPGRTLDVCSCRRNVDQSTFDTRTLCGALVGNNSLVYICKAHLSHLCDVCVSAFSWISGFVPLEQRVFWMFVAFCEGSLFGCNCQFSLRQYVNTKFVVFKFGFKLGPLKMASRAITTYLNNMVNK